MTTLKVKNLEKEPLLPINVSNKCPAIILAVNRIVKVKGRITFLIISIKTINGWSIGGVPFGNKWLKKYIGWRASENPIIKIHTGKAKDSPKTPWVEEVNT